MNHLGALVARARGIHESGRDYSDKASRQSTVESREQEEEKANAETRRSLRHAEMPRRRRTEPRVSIFELRVSLLREASEEGIGLPLRPSFGVGDCAQELTENFFVGCGGGFVYRL